MAAVSQPASGLDHIDAGLRLIRWSRLANVNGFVLTGVDAEEFERHQSNVEGQVGRLICWVTFAVGCEYILKGVCNVRGQMAEATMAGTNMGKMRKPLLASMTGMSKAEANSVVNVLLKTLKGFRDRDLHHYRRNVRAGNFLALRDEVIPALNRLLERVSPASV